MLPITKVTRGCLRAKHNSRINTALLGPRVRLLPAIYTEAAFVFRNARNLDSSLGNG